MDIDLVQPQCLETGLDALMSPALLMTDLLRIMS